MHLVHARLQNGQQHLVVGCAPLRHARGAQPTAGAAHRFAAQGRSCQAPSRKATPTLLFHPLASLLRVSGARDYEISAAHDPASLHCLGPSALRPLRLACLSAPPPWPLDFIPTHFRITAPCT